jgi:hypothetical protein
MILDQIKIIFSKTILDQININFSTTILDQIKIIVISEIGRTNAEVMRPNKDKHSQTEERSFKK